MQREHPGQAGGRYVCTTGRARTNPFVRMRPQIKKIRPTIDIKARDASSTDRALVVCNRTSQSNAVKILPSEGSLRWSRTIRGPHGHVRRYPDLRAQVHRKPSGVAKPRVLGSMQPVGSFVVVDHERPQGSEVHLPRHRPILSDQSHARARIADYRVGGPGWAVIRCAHNLRQTDRVAGGTRAASAYELGDPVRVKRDLIARVLLLLEGVTTGAAWTQPPMEHHVKVRSTGEIVYRVTTESDLAFNEARASISRDLDQLTIDEFNEQYGLKIRIKGVP